MTSYSEINRYDRHIIYNHLFNLVARQITYEDFKISGWVGDFCISHLHLISVFMVEK